MLLQACDGLLVVLGLDAQNLLIFAQVDVPDLTSLESDIVHKVACDSSLFQVNLGIVERLCFSNH
jgi:hypothetical protein